MQVDMRVLELLSSKICHDLVSPVSAINNGVELIEDIGGSVVEEAMKLIGDSANLASRRLRLFRMAYGRAGSDESLAIKDVKQVAEQYVAGGKLMLTWPEDEPSAALAAQRGFMKTVLNLIILAEETLAYGGVVSLRSVTEEGKTGCRFEIVGRGAQLTPPAQAAYEGTVPVEELTPRTIQAYVVSKFAAHFEFKLKHAQSIPDRLELTLFGRDAAAST
jgi:histidine phosphotransferase ChpT